MELTRVASTKYRRPLQSKMSNRAVKNKLIYNILQNNLLKKLENVIYMFLFNHTENRNLRNLKSKETFLVSETAIIL